MACVRAIAILAVAWSGSSSPKTSLKFVLCSHPAEVVLSVIESTQSPRFSRPSIMSIQGEIIDAMYSRTLFEARKRRWVGSSNRHANPSFEYPPSPYGHESER